MVKDIGRQPWFWTALIATLVYSDIRAFNGGWVYDDAGSVIKNVVVNGKVGWKEAFTRDYWGSPMKEAQSHKSFRPITTLTLKGNFVLGRYLAGEKTEEELLQDKQNLPPTLTFHIVNILLHGIVTGLVTKATSFVMPSDDIVSQIVVGSLFAVHPVHAEVVSNITSRGEMLMSVFFLIAFLSFAGTREKQKDRQGRQQLSLWQQVLGIYLVPWFCMALSLFSKEQGATTLISLVAWDFLKHHGNLVSLRRKLFSKINVGEDVGREKSDDDSAANAFLKAMEERTDAQQFLGRTLVLAVETLMIVAWRYALNGETTPDFVYDQNPAGFAEERFTRAFSITWIYCLYIRDALYPYYLSPDWSGRAIDLITNLSDPRAMAVLALWFVSAQSFWSMIVGAKTTSGSNGRKKSRRKRKHQAGKDISSDFLNDTTLRQLNIAMWAFTFSPFLLSSNILVVIGLMKADRVIYLPLFGFCLFEAILISKFLKGAIRMRTAFENSKEQLFWVAHFFFMFQIIVLSGRTHERNLAWSDSLRLWETAYAVNPRSYHTMYNYGYELSLKQRYVECEAVMRPVGSARVDGVSNTFVYTMVLFNLRQCDRANILLEEAFEVIEEKRAEGAARDTDSSLARSESNLLVAAAHCGTDPDERARLLYKAVEIDPTNDYAVQIATNYMRNVQQSK
mmetsp:Transcript_16665/g.34308  ORF Transcript_16665/g.34308 Transcript_16665/m.34308 type:complete len:678 (-) Transcript_16665:2315-4348(-)